MTVPGSEGNKTAAGARRSYSRFSPPPEDVDNLRIALEELMVAEEELRQQNEELLNLRGRLETERLQYQELFDAAPDPYVVTDSNGVIVQHNAAANAFLNTRPEGLGGKPLAAFVAQDDRRLFRAITVGAARRGQREERVIRFTPRSRPIAYASVSVTGARRHATPTLRWILRDVSDREHARQRLEELNGELEERVRARTVELERANAAKDEFLGMISHELRTPITTIAGTAHVIRAYDKGLSDQERETALSDIEIESHRLHRLIDDLLLLARGGDLNLEPVLPAHVLKRAVDLYVSAQPRAVHVDAPEDLPAILAEPVYLEQVVRNLLNNADKYSPTGEPIEIAAQLCGASVTFSVCDRGGGIPAGEIERIFAPFYRSEETSHTISGAGVGLAVCKRLVEAQGGSIWAESRAGGGTVFSFSLPIAPEWREDTPETTAP